MAQHSPSWCNNSTGWLVTIHQILMPISLLIDQTGKTEQVEPAKLFQEPQQESRWTQRVQQRTSWLRCVPRVRRDGGVVAGSRQPAYLGKTTSQWACHQCPIGVHFFQDGGKWSNGRMILVGHYLLQGDGGSQRWLLCKDWTHQPSRGNLCTKNWQNLPHQAFHQWKISVVSLQGTHQLSICLGFVPWGTPGVMVCSMLSLGGWRQSMLEFIVHHSQPDGRKSRCEDNGKKNNSQVVSSNTVWRAVNRDTHGW